MPLRISNYIFFSIYGFLVTAQSLELSGQNTMIYSTPQLGKVMQITIKEVKYEELDEADLSVNFLINQIIICDF